MRLVSIARRSLATRRTRTAAAALLVTGLQLGVANAAQSILFIGNSFTYGDLAPMVRSFHPETVTDLRGTGIGGVPALFKAFTQQSGLDYDVYLETQPGSNLDYHYNTWLGLLNRPWDNVVMHGQSNLDFAAPNNPAKISTYTGLLGNVFQAQNPNVDISLTATWSRADLTYRTPSPWFGAPITAMGIDVHRGYQVAAANNPTIVSRINPVGLAWNASFEAGIADANPYDGIDPGKINLWASDAYHASSYGYYLHALTVFGMETGLDPRSLGANESAARELGFTTQQTLALQNVAAQTIAVAAIPEPETWAMMMLGVGAIGVWRRRRAKQVA
ncbi:MAG TPA: PEP-CTERM sorting domain-containing protein [Caldimonas sp.]|jgi:hypothetical protein|nr:PEP-CTERM sorting domain-containing protein [Caldimonas sp.]HEX2541349.1 PEP-CTERM sorting domain-containing protein [Caldimonas sp.]